MLRKILRTKVSVPQENLYLELGCLNIKTILKARRINYLHYLVSTKETEMLNKFFDAQWKYPTNDDWTTTVQTDLEDFGIDFKVMKTKSKTSFIKFVKRKAKEYALDKYLTKKERHSKMEGLFYSEVKIQSYLSENTLTADQSRTVFSYRTRMAQYGENYQNNNGHTMCPLCLTHLDSQAFSFSCPMIVKNVPLKGKYKNIFSDKIDTDLANTLISIDKFRDDYVNNRYVE